MVSYCDVQRNPWNYAGWLISYDNTIIHITNTTESSGPTNKNPHIMSLEWDEEGGAEDLILATSKLDWKKKFGRQLIKDDTSKKSNGIPILDSPSSIFYNLSIRIILDSFIPSFIQLLWKRHFKHCFNKSIFWWWLSNSTTR